MVLFNIMLRPLCNFFQLGGAFGTNILPTGKLPLGALGEAHIMFAGVAAVNIAL
jgi:hypothetical protein